MLLLAQWERGTHLKPIRPPVLQNARQKHTHQHESLSPWFSHTYSHLCWQNSVSVFISKFCWFHVLFSWALTHKHTDLQTNKEPFDSLHCWQASQGIIRSRLYIVAVCQVFLEFAARTKSHLTELLLLSPFPFLHLLLLLSQVSYSLSSSSFCHVWFFVRCVLGLDKWPTSWISFLPKGICFCHTVCKENKENAKMSFLLYCYIYCYKGKHILM